MFHKIIIAEDIDSISLGLASILEKLTATEIVYTKYCDDTILKIKRALIDGNPFELLITDLSFTADHRNVVLKNGEDLILAVRNIQPDIKIIAYSVEDRIHKIKYLFDGLGINGYVWKGRESASDMHKAIDSLANNVNFLPQRFSHILHPANTLEITKYDTMLLSMLAGGSSQAEICDYFKNENQPSSSSSIEKHINRLKIILKAKTSSHLVIIAKDMGII